MPEVLGMAPQQVQIDWLEECVILNISSSPKEMGLTDIMTILWKRSAVA